MASFDIARQKTLAAEGGYSNDQNDRGGRTYAGISEKNFPNWSGWVIINKLEPLRQGAIINDQNLSQMVDKFYNEEFWTPLRLSDIRSQSVADEIYDTAVNMGKGAAAKLLQRALNILNRNQKSFADIAADGIIGGGTIATVNNFCKDDVTINQLVKTLNGLQFARYVAICEADATQENNFIGWLKRV